MDELNKRLGVDMGDDKSGPAVDFEDVLGRKIEISAEELDRLVDCWASLELVQEMLSRGDHRLPSVLALFRLVEREMGTVMGTISRRTNRQKVFSNLQSSKRVTNI